VVFFYSTVSSPTEIYTLSLHDALPIWLEHVELEIALAGGKADCRIIAHHLRHHHGHGFRLGRIDLARHDRAARLVFRNGQLAQRSEEHTSELQSRENLVCRLLLEKKNK